MISCVNTGLSESGHQADVRRHTWNHIKESLASFSPTMAPVSWALQSTKKGKRKTDNVVNFLTAAFTGGDTPRVSIPDLARTMRQSDKFDRSEWLTERQIKQWLGTIKNKQLSMNPVISISDVTEEDLNQGAASNYGADLDAITAEFESVAKDVLTLEHPIEVSGLDQCYLNLHGDLKKEDKEALKLLCDKIGISSRKNAAQKTLLKELEQHVQVL